MKGQQELELDTQALDPGATPEKIIRGYAKIIAMDVRMKKQI